MQVQELKVAMLRKGYTQGMLADELGLNKSTVSQKFKGKRQFTLLEIQKISKILELTASERDTIFFS